MAKGKKGVDGIDKVIELFPAGSHKMIERLLARAADREARAAGLNVKAAMRSALGRGGRIGNKMAKGLAANLARALRQRGDVGGNKASIRRTAPDTGGRPFHFAHSVVSKADAAPAASGRGPKTGGTASGASPTGRGKTGKAAAHMRYIEREIAVERTYGQQHDGPDRERGAGDLGRDGDGHEREAGRAADDQVHATSSGAAQAYIENPVKLANGERIVFSFGTIGDVFEDRVAFWEALEEAEAHPQARVQHRLIVELPHEASPQARHDMIKAFTKRFEDDGIPYWAALHAPGKDNDSRNFHAHIVYSERPAKRMVDPARPNEGEKWDFSITKTHRKKSRNLVTSRPHRQEKLRSYHARDFIPTIRGEFAATVNAILLRDAVKDAKGEKVLYDARSYKDMGVDAVPMRSINRIVADKMKDGQLTVLDGDYTRRMIAAELREAAAKRQKGVMELIALDEVLRATADASRPHAHNAKLPKDLRISPWANPGKAALRAAGRKILEARHAALQIDVMERATTASLERIIAATAPKAVDAAARSKDPAVKAEAASPDAARMLHAAAIEELAETKASTAKARRTMRFRVGSAVDAWRTLVQTKPPEISQAVKASIREMDRREERAERSPSTQRAPSAPQAERGQGTTASMVREEPSLTRDRHIDEGRPQRGGASAKTTDAMPEVTAARTATEPASPKDGVPRTRRERGAAGDREAGEKTSSPGRADTRRASAVARPSTAASVARPASMEDALRIRMPPTVPELEEASRRVSGWIRAVIEGEDDVDVRMTKIETFVDALKADVRARQGLPPLEGDALIRTSMRLDETVTTPDVAEASQGRRAKRDVTVPDAAAGALGMEVTPGLTGTGAGAAGTPREGEVSPGAMGPKGPKRMGGGEREEPTQTADDPAGPPEDPDDARRRKKREAEIEKRKRQRQAVLARKNRGRER